MKSKITPSAVGLQGSSVCRCCSGKADFQNPIIFALLQQKGSLEKTLLHALGLSLLYIGLVPFLI